MDICKTLLIILVSGVLISTVHVFVGLFVIVKDMISDAVERFVGL